MKFLSNPKFMQKFHGIATLTWGILIIPSILWWKESIMWVVLMSAWANFASHWAAYQGASAEDSQERPGVKLREGKK